MNDSAGLERQVTDWLRSRATADGMDEVLAVSLARAARVPQERPKATRWLPVRRLYLRPLIAATALAIAVMVVAVSSIPPLPKAASARVTGVWPTGPDVVFTATLPPGAPPDIYWRAVAYDTWSSVDRGWLASDQTVTPVDAGSSILDVVSEPHSVDADEISVSIVPEQAGTIVVAPGLVVTVDQAAQIGTSGPGGPLVQVALAHPSPSYRVTAIDPLAATATQLAGAGRDYPSDIRERYAGTPDPREFGPASTAFIRAIDDVAGDDPYLVATRIVDAFQDPRFTYATDTRNVDCGAEGFTECFLRVKRGYCMYYATAMVMLLRHEGIPARFVEGFLPGERVGMQETVRTQNAHAWVEVYFPRFGWVTFDPTPRGTPQVIAGS
jgi:transglutaminase-like putative cysteine protease